MINEVATFTLNDRGVKSTCHI